MKCLYLILGEISRASEFSLQASKVHFDLLAEGVLKSVKIAGQSVDELGLFVDHFGDGCSVNVVFWHIFENLENSLLEGLDLWDRLVFDLDA